VIDVTEATFREVVEASMKVLVIIDLWAEWCQPCKQLSPALERVVNSYNGTVLLAKVDVDENPRISQAFGVQSIPTVVAIAGGQPVDMFTGAQPEPEVRRWIQRLVDALKDQLPGMSATGTAAPPAPPDPLFVQAETALDEGDFDAAIAAYEQYLVNNPGDADVKLAVAQLKFQQRAAGLPPDAVDRAQAAPDDLGLQLDAATLLFATGEFEPAFKSLVDAFAQAAGDDAARDQLREHLLNLFDLLGHDDPRVVKWRRRFAAALY
jgi:putative thioredoxin